jgi:hypothetical protein
VKNCQNAGSRNRCNVDDGVLEMYCWGWAGRKPPPRPQQPFSNSHLPATPPTSRPQTFNLPLIPSLEVLEFTLSLFLPISDWRSLGSLILHAAELPRTSRTLTMYPCTSPQPRQQSAQPSRPSEDTSSEHALRERQIQHRQP